VPVVPGVERILADLHVRSDPALVETDSAAIDVISRLNGGMRVQPRDSPDEATASSTSFVICGYMRSVGSAVQCRCRTGIPMVTESGN